MIIISIVGFSISARSQSIEIGSTIAGNSNALGLAVNSSNGHFFVTTLSLEGQHNLFEFDTNGNVVNSTRVPYDTGPYGNLGSMTMVNNNLFIFTAQYNIITGSFTNEIIEIDLTGTEILSSFNADNYGRGGEGLTYDYSTDQLFVSSYYLSNPTLDGINFVGESLSSQLFKSELDIAFDNLTGNIFGIYNNDLTEYQKNSDGTFEVLNSFDLSYQVAGGGLAIDINQNNGLLYIQNNQWIVEIDRSTLTSVADTESCNSSYTLPSNQWRQIVLPCDPGTGNSVEDVFSDDIAEAFGEVESSYPDNWKIFQYDSANNNYILLEETSALEVGVGYWIIQQSGNNASLRLPTNSNPIPAIQSAACSSEDGCFEIQLNTLPEAIGWNMIGRPSHYNFKLGDVQIQANIDDCSDGCGLGIAKNKMLFEDRFWTYDGISSYTVVNNPDGIIEPWVGYWAATLQNADGTTPKLLIPKEDVTPLSDNFISGRVKNRQE